jgi:predicted transcriptional regulator
LRKKEKSVRSEFEKKVLKMMIDYNVDQTDLAHYEGVTPQAINNRLKRLNNERYQAFKKLIITITNGQDS